MILNNLSKYKIKLASNSPRRRELLSGLGIDYEVKILPGIDETYPDTLQGEEIPVYIARKKADAYRPAMEKDELIITADTIVYINGKVLGKPRDEADARYMLRQLSGSSHQVITGVCITTCEFQKTFSTTTEVTFDNLTNEEIDFYIERYHPMDKAGSYGIQEWIGFIGVSGIHGSYSSTLWVFRYSVCIRNSRRYGDRWLYIGFP